MEMLSVKGKTSKFRLTEIFIAKENLNCLVAMVTCVMGGHVIMDYEGDQQLKRCRNWQLVKIRPVLMASLLTPGER